MNAYVAGMFQPLGFLGSVYGWVIQALVDIKNLSQLLTEPIEVTDIEDAESLPFMDQLSKSKNTNIRSRACKKCFKSWDSSHVGSTTWRFCPYCAADSWDSAAMVEAESKELARRSAGISVEFESKL